MMDRPKGAPSRAPGAARPPQASSSPPPVKTGPLRAPNPPVTAPAPAPARSGFDATSFMVGVAVGGLTFFLLDRYTDGGVGKLLGTVSAPPAAIEGDRTDNPGDIDVTFDESQSVSPQSYGIPPVIEEQLRALLRSGRDVVARKMRDGIQYCTRESNRVVPLVTAQSGRVQVNRQAMDARLREIPM